MRIDSHHHLWDLEAVHYPWLMAKGEVRFFGDPAPIARNYLADEFTADARAHDFEGSVHIQVGAADGLAEARWVDGIATHQQAAQENWAMRQVAFCDLSSPHLTEDLEALSALPSVAGVRQIIGRAPGEDALTGTRELIESPAFEQGLRQLAHYGFSFDLQLLPELMAPMAQLLKTIDDVPIALCHAGSPYDRTDEGLAYWADQLQYLSQLPHVSAKLSGLGMFAHGWEVDDFAPITQAVLDQFGAERVMFGSNFPVCSLTSDYSKLIEAYEQLIPQDAQAHIFGKTAARFYRF